MVTPIFIREKQNPCFETDVRRANRLAISALSSTYYPMPLITGMIQPSRNQALLVTLACAGIALALSSSVKAKAAIAQPPKAETLKEAFASRFAMGAAISGTDFNELERRVLFSNFTTVTPGNCMKPEPVHPAENRFEFAKADGLVEMARANGLTVNGHCLIWHSQCPNWFFVDGDKPAEGELVRKRMRDHIAAVAGHFAGKLASWDVVNEAIDDGPDYLRKTKWLNAMGPGYIADAFRAAHQADPKAELYYNDYNIERPEKRTKAVRLIRQLKAEKAPIQGIGIQGHWELDHIPFKDIEESILAFDAEGLKVMITELDIDVVKRKTSGGDAGAKEQQGSDPYSDGLPPEIQQRLADQYAKLFALFLKHSDKIARITFWGLHDGKSWLNNWPSKRTNHPLLWDRAVQPKPALAAVLAVAAAAPPVPSK